MVGTAVRDEYLDILNELSNHHALFAEFWNVGTLEDCEEIPTAAIEFDELGSGVRFLINPKFWDALTREEQLFVICHECLHVYYGHGARFRGLKDKMIANKAGDVVINHALLKAFGFNRNKLEFKPLTTQDPISGKTIRGTDTLCWRDTLFPNNRNIREDGSMEYYYSQLEKEKEEKGGAGGGNGAGQTLDDHETIRNPSNGSGDSSQQDKMAQDFVDSLTKRMAESEVEDFESKVKQASPEEANNAQQQAGTVAGGMVKKIRLGKIKKKRKWETVVQDVVGKFKGTEQEIVLEQWAQKNRRLTCMNPDLLLPTEINDVRQIRDRIDLWFFQDTSGSCVSYAERFFKAAASIPEDRFKIRGFCFDTKTYEVDFRKCELKGFGGTMFQPIENCIQNIVKTEGCQYPQAVFIITDGYGSSVTPQYPKAWHWFITNGGSTRCIPNESKHYLLKDYE